MDLDYVRVEFQPTGGSRQTLREFRYGGKANQGAQGANVVYRALADGVQPSRTGAGLDDFQFLWSVPTNFAGGQLIATAESVRGGTPQTFAFPVQPAPNAAITLHLKTIGKRKTLVNAQGYVARVFGMGISRSLPTGWGGASGKAEFKKLPPGNYTVSATVYRLQNGQRVPITVSQNITVSWKQDAPVSLGP